MKEHSHTTEKTSRRKFTKSVAAALVSAPLAASLVSAQREQNSGGVPSAKLQDSATTRMLAVSPLPTEHDTPPPTVIQSGSLIIETEKEFDSIVLAGQRKKHRRRPMNPISKIYPSHIKILDGSGEMLYRNLNASSCQIVILLDDNSVVNVTGGEYFEIETAGDRNLVKGSGGDVPLGTKRKVRYRHKDNNNAEPSIQDVKIVEGTDVLYKVSLPKLTPPASPDEFRIMIWVHEM